MTKEFYKMFTLQKFGMRGQINCLEKRLKICHILYTQKSKGIFPIFHFVLYYFFPIMNAPLVYVDTDQGFIRGENKVSSMKLKMEKATTTLGFRIPIWNMANFEAFL